MLKKLIEKIKNKELKKYILWKLSYKNIKVYLKRILFKLKYFHLLLNDSPFVAIKSQHGKIVINLNDIYISSQIIENGNWEMDEINFLKSLLIKCREKYGNGVVALDCGANLGVHTLEFSKLMKSWGEVYSFEPQEPIFNALCETMSINKCENVNSYNLALGEKDGFIEVPVLDYRKKLNFGGLELSESNKASKIDDLHIQASETYKVKLRTIDSFKFSRVDLVKIDVEGMELEVLKGSQKMLLNLKPIIFYENTKSNSFELKNFLEINNYAVVKEINKNSIAINKDSKIYPYFVN
tara:strand:+ start:121 stop:1008 length:888 start_codon:yes stop_codon:yes gene_type:complete